MTHEELVKELSAYCNAYKPSFEEFIQAMDREHRTIQQRFTQLCVDWIAHVGSDEYRFDGRNQASHEYCKALIDVKPNFPVV